MHQSVAVHGGSIIGVSALESHFVAEHLADGLLQVLVEAREELGVAGTSRQALGLFHLSLALGAKGFAVSVGAAHLRGLVSALPSP